MGSASHTVAFFRAPKLLGVLDVFWRVLPCKSSGRCVESSRERCCNLGGDAEVCVGGCSQDYDPLLQPRLRRTLTLWLQCGSHKLANVEASFPFGTGGCKSSA